MNDNTDLSHQLSVKTQIDSLVLEVRLGLLGALAPLWRARRCPAARVTFQGHGALILQLLHRV